MPHAVRKERITVSLPAERVRFLESIRDEDNSSMSALFDQLVADLQERVELARFEQQTRAYYDSIPDEVIAEESAWATHGLAAIASQRE